MSRGEAGGDVGGPLGFPPLPSSVAPRAMEIRRFRSGQAAPAVQLERGGGALAAGPLGDRPLSWENEY